jgi:IS4 transposase
MARTPSIDIRGELSSLVPACRLKKLARESGAVKRERKVKIVDLFWTLVLGFGTGKEKTFAGLRRLYEVTARQEIVPSAFWDRFTPALARFVKRVAEEVMAQVCEASTHLQGCLEGFRDLIVTDSTVIRLHEMLEGAFPACRTNHTKAAAKLHVVMSVLADGPRKVKVTSERTNDGKALKVGPWVKDRLLLFDLGYYGFQLFDRIRRNGGYFISRLKENANLRIVDVHPSRPGDKRLVGRRLQEVLLGLRRDTLDVIVEVRFFRRTYAGKRRRATERFRVVGVRDRETKEYHLYITNIPVEQLDGEAVAASYRARWIVELLFAEWKGGYGLDDIPTRKEEAVQVFIWTSVVTLLASRRLLDVVRKRMRNVAHRISPTRWARVFQTYVPTILQMLLAPPRHVRYLARAIETSMLHEAVDPHVNRPGLVLQAQKGTLPYLAET